MLTDVLSYFVRAQNAAVIFRKLLNETLAESFEVSPCAKRMGMQFSLTHMGKILDGRLLREEDFLN